MAHRLGRSPGSDGICNVVGRDDVNAGLSLRGSEPGGQRTIRKKGTPCPNSYVRTRLLSKSS